MKNLKLELENIKCEGCEYSINKGLLSLDGVLEVVKIDRDNQTIEMNVADECQTDAVSEKLKSMGYPAKGDGDWITSAKSYVSCAIGRIAD